MGQLTSIQKRLLTMLEELVDLCNKHGIAYYAAGGTALGAMRHKGFIPWDDDADLMMPRKDWKRFVRIAQAGLPPNRALCCLELDEHYPHVFGRYVDTTSCAIHYNQFLGGTPEGLAIDIFILDPIPDAGEAYREHCERLALYNDVANPIGYSYPMSSNAKLLVECDARVRKQGRRAVLDELEQRVAAYDEGEYLVMRWAAAPRLFHKNIFAFPRTQPFEGLQISIPSLCADYLVQHYGDNWMYIPPAQKQATHDAVMFADVSYRDVMDDYLPFIDVPRTRKAILARRNYHIRHMDALRRSQDLTARAFASFAREETFRRVQASKTPPAQALEEGNHTLLDWMFAEYYARQFSATLEGRKSYLNIRRYHDPIFVDIGDDLMRIATLNLLDTNRVGLASRLLRVREIAGGPMTLAANSAKYQIQAVQMPASLDDAGCRDEALEFSEQVLSVRPRNYSNRLYRLGRLYETGRMDQLAKEASQALGLYPQSGEFMKYEADCLYANATNRRQKEDAFQTYAQALALTTHEGLATDVRSKLEKDAASLDAATYASLQDALTHRSQAVPKQQASYDAKAIADKTFSLLAELCDLCDEEGIKHFLGPDTTMLALAYGANEIGAPILDLLVPARQMPKLLQAIENKAMANRAVDCWQTNRNYLAYQLDYVDVQTTFIQLEEGTNISAPGLKVRVLPIRETNDSLSAKLLGTLETGWEINGYQLTKSITSKRIAAAAMARASMVAGRRVASRKLFAALSDVGANSSANSDLAQRSSDGHRLVSVKPQGRDELVFEASALDGDQTIAFHGRAFPVLAQAQIIIERSAGHDWRNKVTSLAPDCRQAIISDSIPYTQALQILEADGCSTQKLFSLMKQIRIGMIPLANDLRIRSRAMLMVERSADRKRWFDYLDKRREQIYSMVEQGDYEGLGQLFEGYEQAACRYLNHGLALCPSKEFLDVLCSVLRRKDREELAAKLERLTPRRHYRPLGG